jgi:hypothetical protein
MRLVSHGQSTKLLIRRDAQEAGLAKFPPHVVGELIVPVCLRGQFFGNLAPCKVPNRLAELVQVSLRGWCEVLWMLGGGVTAGADSCDLRASEKRSRAAIEKTGC